MAKQLKLSDGRNLDYSVDGDLDGFPLLWHHGTPGAYVVFDSLAKSCKHKGLKLISFSRAGYGGSSRRRGRNIADDVDDVRELLGHLGVKEFVVGGWSGGGPHSLGCAAKHEDCLASLVVAGVAPYDVEGLDWLAGQGQDNIDEYNATIEGEDALKKYCDEQRVGFIKATAAEIAEQMASIIPDVDKKAMLETPGFDVYMEQIGQEGLKNSTYGWMDDSIAFLKPWGFDVADLKVPIFLYQGSLDLMVPFSHGQWLGKNINKQYLTSHLEQSQGHISIMADYMNQMLDELKGVVDAKR